MPERKITKSIFKCKDCETLLHSKHRHDFVMCQCGNFVDGGTEYTRMGGKIGALISLCEYEED